MSSDDSNIFGNPTTAAPSGDVWGDDVDASDLPEMLREVQEMADSAPGAYLVHPAKKEELMEDSPTFEFAPELDGFDYLTIQGAPVGVDDRLPEDSIVVVPGDDWREIMGHVGRNEQAALALAVEMFLEGDDEQ